MCTAVAVLLLALGTSPAEPRPTPAGPVAQLTLTLSRLAATSAVKARIEHRFTFRAGDDEPTPPPGVATVTAAAGPDGLRLTWSPPLLARAEQEEQARATNPDTATPTRDALTDLRLLAVAHALDAVPELLRDLREAKVLEDRPEPLDGTPARLLVLETKPTLAARERRYIKEIEAHVRLWLDADGVPVAAERRTVLKGRAFLVVSFQTEQKEVLRFVKRGDRLLVARQESTQRSEGAGETGIRQSVTTLTLVE